MLQSPVLHSQNVIMKGLSGTGLCRRICSDELAFPRTQAAELRVYVASLGNGEKYMQDGLEG